MNLATPIPASLLGSLESFLLEKLGHRVIERRLGQVAGTIEALARESGYLDPEDFLDLARTLPVDAPLVQSMIQCFTNKESSFFHDPLAYDSLEKHVLTELIAKNAASRSLRIWSAGCSTGEEVYSIAILLQKLLPESETWTIHILGTDIDAQAVQKARLGEYRSWALRSMQLVERTRYFEYDAKSATFGIREKYRRNVSFGLHNLADPSAPIPEDGTFDLVLCKNVLSTFSAEARGIVARKFEDALRPGGVWVSGARDPDPSHGFVSNPLPGLVVHRPHRAGSAVHLSPASSRVRPAIHPPAKGPTQGDPPWIATSEFIAPSSRRRASEIRELFETGSSVPSGYSSDLETKLRKARDQADSGHFEAARAALLDLIADEPLSYEPYLLLARVEHGLGRIEHAKSELKRSLFLNPSNPEAHLLLGHLSAASGDREQALRSFRSAVLLVGNLEAPAPESTRIRDRAAAEVIRLLREEHS